MLLNIIRIRNSSQSSERTPLVSICIPTRNRGELLIERAISSILKQTYQNFEVIIVGDHCTDNTEELLSKLKDPRIRFYNLPERDRTLFKNPEIRWFAGPVRPLNRANKMVRGKWIARIDDDDIWTPDHIEVLLRFAQKGNYEFVCGDYVAERYGKRKTISCGGQTWLFRSYLKLFKYDENCWKKKWNRVSDTDIYDRWKKAGVKMGHISKIVAYVLPRPREETIGLDAYKLYENSSNNTS